RRYIDWQTATALSTGAATGDDVATSPIATAQQPAARPGADARPLPAASALPAGKRADSENRPPLPAQTIIPAGRQAAEGDESSKPSEDSGTANSRPRPEVDSPAGDTS